MNFETINTFNYIVINLVKSLILSYYIFSILNKKHSYPIYIINALIYFLSITVIAEILSDSLKTLVFILLITLLYSISTRIKISTALIVCTLSVSIHNIIQIIAVILNFLPNKLIFQFPDLINTILISLTHIVFVFLLLHIKMLKKGFNYLVKSIENDYINILILNISVGIIFSFILFMNIDISIFHQFFPPLVIFAILMIVTIYYSVKQYYKQKLFNTELRESKQKIELMKNEITRLETENLSYSKINHTLKHKQRTLEYKAATLAFNSEIANELTPIIVPALFNSTEIKELDDLFSYMQAECNKNEIDLELQIKCNLFELINNFITLEDLETLLSDHIRNSIIALNNSNNINKSLLIKIGQYNSCYVISIYDSGIEFKLSTLEKLGTTPITTHSGTGGSGLGFMNTFDTLKKYEITMEINEIGEESVDNYTKSITFIFNKTFNFNIKSYRKNS